MNSIELIVEHELLGMMESAEKTLQYACPCKFCCEPYHETNKPTFIIIIFFLHLEWMARQNNATLWLHLASWYLVDSKLS